MGVVTEIKKANGEVMRIIDGEYVIGANHGCFSSPKPCRKILNGEYLVEGECEGCVIDGVEYDRSTTEIYLSAMSSFPECVCNLVNLISLYMNNNNFASPSECIGNLVNLKYLNLSSNTFTSLPESIGNLVNLIVFEAAANQLTSLPDGIGNLVNLEYLYLEYNQLTSLPDGIGNLVNLIGMSFIGNQLTSLPDGIGNLVNLEYLYLDSNSLTTLPESIKNIDKNNLYIFLENNNFTDEYKDYIRNELFPLANAAGRLYL